MKSKRNAGKKHVPPVQDGQLGRRLKLLQYSVDQLAVLVERSHRQEMHRLASVSAGIGAQLVEVAANVGDPAATEQTVARLRALASTLNGMGQPADQLPTPSTDSEKGTEP